jgi:hypothetical protein
MWITSHHWVPAKGGKATESVQQLGAFFCVNRNVNDFGVAPDSHLPKFFDQ